LSPPKTQGLDSLFIASYDSQGCGGGIRTSLHDFEFHYSYFRIDVNELVKVAGKFVYSIMEYTSSSLV
jgi:hypothetical protein